MPYSSKKIVFADLAAMCPFPSSVSPHYERCREESSAWVEHYMARAGTKRRVIDSFKSGLSELLASLAYSYASYEQLRLCCDFLNLLFVYDELSDELDGKGASTSGTVFLETVTKGKIDESILSDVVDNFMTRFAQMSPSPKCLARFKGAITDYILAVSEEAELRDNDHVLSIESYIPLRRENSAVRPCFGLFELIHKTELPDEVFEDTVFQRIYRNGVDLVWIANDLFSYKMERDKNLDGNNLVTVAMREKGLDVQGAVDYVADYFKQLLEQFLEDKKHLRTFGKDVDVDVAKYIFSISQWIVGNIVWSFETPRYFGAEHEEVKRTLVCRLDTSDEEDSGYGSENDSELASPVVLRPNLFLSEIAASSAC